MLADFTITIHDARKPLAVRVKIHDNVAALRGASTKHAKTWQGKKDADFSDTLGICHRFHLKDDPLCAIVRLAPPDIGIGIVSHELTHAAVWLWEIHNKFDRKAALACDNDEWFCWVLGDLIRRTVNKLYEKGVYK